MCDGSAISASPETISSNHNTGAHALKNLGPVVARFAITGSFDKARANWKMPPEDV